MPKTILFDLDGTIMNSAEGITEGVRLSLETFGLPTLPYSTLEKFIGPPLRDSFVGYCGVSEELAEELLTDYRKYYAKTGLYKCKPYPGIPKLLEQLLKKGDELMIATSKPTEFAKTVLKSWKLDGYFSEIIGAGFTKNSDSKGRIVAVCIEKAKHDEILMVGDTVFDVEGARENQIPAVAVLYGFGDREELKAAKPSYIAETVEELGGIL